MADLKISQMPKVSILTGEEIIPIVQNLTNKSVSVSVLHKDLATQQWVQTAIDNAGGKTVVTPTLPLVGDANKIYLVPNNSSRANDVYDEYIYIIGEGWEFLGNKQVTVDFTNYYTKEEVDIRIQNSLGQIASVLDTINGEVI